MEVLGCAHVKYSHHQPVDADDYFTPRQLAPVPCRYQTRLIHWHLQAARTLLPQRIEKRAGVKQICVCVCVCVCERERLPVRVCVCVHV